MRAKSRENRPPGFIFLSLCLRQAILAYGIRFARTTMGSVIAERGSIIKQQKEMQATGRPRQIPEIFCQHARVTSRHGRMA